MRNIEAHIHVHNWMYLRFFFSFILNFEDRFFFKCLWSVRFFARNSSKKNVVGVRLGGCFIVFVALLVV